MNLTFSGSCNIIDHMTTQLTMGDFLLVVHCDHASILHCYSDIAIWSSCRKALPGTEVGRWSVGCQYYTNVIYSSLLH